MKALINNALLALGLGAPITQTKRAPDPAPLPSHELVAPVDSAGSITRSRTNEAELLSHRDYKAKDEREVHSPAKSTHEQVPLGASAKCRDGTCSPHGGAGAWL